MGIKCHQGKYTIKMLMESDEIFVTNSVMGIMPVYCVEDYVMTGGLPGKMTDLFLTEYQKMMEMNGVILQPQLHKIIWHPDTRRV